MGFAIRLRKYKEKGAEGLLDKRGRKLCTSAAFPVAICAGGSGKTELTVTDSDGKTAAFKITCQVTQMGKQ